MMSLSALSVFVLSLFFWYSHNGIVQLKADVSFYADIIQDVHDLTLLNNDIVLHQVEKRTIRQWHEKIGSLHQKLFSLDERVADRTKLEFLKSEHTKMNTLFHKLEQSYRYPKRGAQEYQKRLIGQMQIHLYNIVRGIEQIIKQLRLERLEQEEARENLMFIGVIGISLIIAVMMRYWIMSIVRPLDRLQKRVAQISDGEFKSEIDLKDNDEFGDFSRALEEMTHKFLSAIEQLHSEIDQRKLNEASLEKMNQQLVELDRLKTLFIASMSHELRTPLNAIIGFSGVLKSKMAGELNEKQSGYLERIHKAGKNLLAMIVDVIDISKLESGKLPFSAEEFSLKEMLEELIAENRDKFKKKGLESRLLIDEDVTLYTDRFRLKHSIGNYLGNALKFSEKGVVTIGTRISGNEVEIEVSDEGIGIEKGDIDKIFKPFERLDSRLKVIAGGAGLGLYLTKKIVTGLMGGEVYVKSTLGEGSTFGLRIPIHFKGVIKGVKSNENG